MTSPDWTRAKWRKSSHSGHDGGECVELAAVDDMIAVRDSKNPSEPGLAFSRSEWKAFVDGVKTAS